jgi:hypothetical protein
MLLRSRLLILIPALLLIPIFLGLTPLNFAHKMGTGCPMTKAAPILKCASCPFNSLVSHNDLSVCLDSTPINPVVPVSRPQVLCHAIPLSEASLISASTSLRC